MIIIIYYTIYRRFAPREHWWEVGRVLLKLGDVASRGFDMCLRNSCGSFAEYYGDLRRLSFSHVAWPTSIAEICGDNESTQKLRRQISNSWLMKFPSWNSQCLIFQESAGSVRFTFVPRFRTVVQINRFDSMCVFDSFPIPSCYCERLTEHCWSSPAWNLEVDESLAQIRRQCELPKTSEGCPYIVKDLIFRTSEVAFPRGESNIWGGQWNRIPPAVRACTYLSLSLYIYIYIYIIYVFLCVYIYIYIYIYSIYIYIYIERERDMCVYIYIYTHINICICQYLAACDRLPWAARIQWGDQS